MRLCYVAMTRGKENLVLLAVKHYGDKALPESRYVQAAHTSIIIVDVILIVIPFREKRLIQHAVIVEVFFLGQQIQDQFVTSFLR